MREESSLVCEVKGRHWCVREGSSLVCEGRVVICVIGPICFYYVQ